MKKENNVIYLDQLRVILVSVVIFLNMSGVYGQVSPWCLCIGTPDKLTLFVSDWFVGVVRPWLLGVFFLVTGAIAVKLYEKDARSFIGDRLTRLGVPSLIYFVLINPLLVFAGKSGTVSFSEFVTSQWLKFKVLGFGPLWFAVTLLAVSLCLPLFINTIGNKKLTSSGIIIFGLLLSLVTFVLRVWFPVGTYSMSFHIAFLPQFLAMTVVGMIAWKSGWLKKTTDKQFWICLIISLACVAVWPLISGANFNGGFNVWSLVRTLWESVLLISASFVFVHGARRWLNRPTKLWVWLTDNGYGVYVLHAIVLVAVALMLGSLGLHPLIMWLGLATLCVPLTFAVAWLVRMIPGVKRVL